MINNKNFSKTKKTAVCGLLTALALIFSYVEFLIPISIGVPGIKLGFANIVVLITLYILGPSYAFGVNMARIGLSALLFGSLFSALYALAGGLLSFAVMLICKRTGLFSPVGVSLAGGVFHNLGQLAVAAAVMETPKILMYFPVLLFSGMACGIITGFFSVTVMKHVKML